MTIETTIKRIHMVGIGGVGMSGIAQMLHHIGYQVSGSDIATSKSLDKLAKMGIAIHIGHTKKVVKKVDVLVYSSAIDESNIEIKTARKRRIPIISRAAMLGELMRFRKGIAVAGTHGKTTTTSLLSLTLIEAGLQPTYVIGGILNATSSNAALGQGQYIVAEADESDASFLQLLPILAVVTNIDLDHMSTYQDDPEQLQNTFIKFIHNLPFYGTCVMCLDDEGVQKVLPHIMRRVITYGFNQEADFQITKYQQQKTKGIFTVLDKRTKQQKQWEVNMPGKHNALNALACTIVAAQLEIGDAAIEKILREFSGVGRRFSITENCQLDHKSYTWVDDYAHHPREIDATREAFTHAYEQSKIVVFQPHRYSRTRDLFDDFVTSLSQFDVRILILTEVYAATEERITGADTEALISALRLRGINNVIFAHDQEELYQVLSNVIEADDVLLTMGAGSISNWMGEFVAR